MSLINFISKHRSVYNDIMARQDEITKKNVSQTVSHSNRKTKRTQNQFANQTFFYSRKKPVGKIK